MLELDHLSMHFGALKAVDEVNITIPAGELFAFLGPNGAGKTTTIKMVTGLLRPLSGRVRVCGFDMQDQPVAAKALIGYVPDVAIFYDKLTATEFMNFIADLFQMEESVAQRVTGELFEKFALWPYARQQVENLSHGTKQRLAIAAALLHDPKVIIIDEPMVGLDPIHVRIIKNELKARSLAGSTILMSTHLLNVAEELADRIGIMHQGKLAFIGTMAELRAKAGGSSQELEALFLELVQEEGLTEAAHADPNSMVAG